MRLSSRFEEALTLMCRLHKDQVRKGTQIPYVTHLLAVSSIVLDYGGSEDEAIAALLHDAPEDQGGLEVLTRIRENFGSAVASIVDACTDTYETPKPPWRLRKEAFLQRLPRESRSVHLVSAADKLHNARSVLRDYRIHGEDVWKRFNAGRDETLWYYRSLVDVLRKTDIPALLVDELQQTVHEIEIASDLNS